VARVEIQRGWQVVWGIAMAVLSCVAGAQTMFVATLRDNSANDVGGAIYTVDLKTQHSSLVAPVRIGGAIPIGLTGLTVHPKTGVFYGITGGVSPNLPKSLVTIDPRTGNATLVGSLGFSGADIRFDGKGTLYVWLIDKNCLGTVDLGTGAAKPIESTNYQQTLGGGIAVNREGVVYISANSSAGSLDSYDPRENKLTTGPTLRGAPFVSSLGSMAFGDDGILYGVNSNLGTPAKTRLITVDPKTGEVRDIMALPDDVDSIAFAPASFVRNGASEERGRQREWLFAAIALVVGYAFGFGSGRFRRRLSEKTR
jgi:hypothetical protein